LSINNAISDIGQRSKLKSESGNASAQFEKAVVVSVIYDNAIAQSLLAIAPEIFSTFIPDRIPKNSCLVRRISGGVDATSTSYTLAYPFFSSHISMPVKVGETVWMIFDREVKTVGYWLSRVHGDEYSEDLNFSHYDRIYTAKRISDESVGTIEKSKKTQEKPQEDDFPNLSLKQNEDENEFDKISLAASSDPVIFEPVPRYSKRPGDLVIHGSNNSMISLGTDRFWKKEDELKDKKTNCVEKPSEFSGTIDLVAGRSRYLISGSVDRTVPESYENNREYKEIVKDPRKGNRSQGVEGDPDFFSDASRIYVSMNTAIDEALSLQDFTPILPNEDEVREPSIGATIFSKSDHIRIVARKEEDLGVNGTIKIIKEGELSNEGDGCSIILHNDGVIHIAGNKIHLGLSTAQGGDTVRDTDATGEGQPYVKYQELKKVLDVIFELINVLADALSKNAPPGYSAPDPGLLSAGLNVMSRIPQETPNISKIKSLRIFGE
jgi:hypothetical protein